MSEKDQSFGTNYFRNDTDSDSKRFLEKQEWFRSQQFLS